MERRNEAFQKLKPVCIALSQSSLAFASNRRDVDKTIQNLERLSRTLEEIIVRPDALDHKIADYVFFPVSQILKASRDLPTQAMEACLRCLAILISKGWQDKIDLNLGGQLLIFLTLSCDTSGKTIPTPLATDELRMVGFQCMEALFNSLNSTPAGKLSLVSTANVPSLAHAVSVILEGISNGESFQVQLSATAALSALISCIDDLEVLSSFLPGMISSLTKVLTPNTQARRHWKVLVASLHIVESLLRSLLSNATVGRITASTKETSTADDQKPNKLNSSWVKATASQLKVAVANINRLRSHERPEVQDAILAFNLTLLSECSQALEDSCTLAAETILLLAQEDSKEPYRDKIATLAQNDPSISSLLSTVFHNEQLSLVRVMQSNNDQAKERSLGKLFGAYSILAGTEVDMTMISKMLSSGLKDSVTTILRPPLDQKTATSRVTPITISDISLVHTNQKSVTFSAPLAEYKSQETLLKYMSQKIRDLRETQPALRLASSLMPALRTTDESIQVAAFWLILQDLRNDSDGVENFMSDILVGNAYSNDQSVSLREELYSFSLNILENDETTDWRLKTLALESIALYAQRNGVDFRGELVEALYPILHHLGSESGYVRNHAMTCLNIVSDVCGYSDAGDLVVSNVDYLVNAVALKLNAFDVSPQGPQVLLMMVRLAGPSLLPYLEDTLESIFAALEDYHGYTALVELLFAVLRTMAEEGVKAPMLTITSGEEPSKDNTRRWSPTDMAELVKIIKDLAQEKPEPLDQPEDEPSERNESEEQDLESEPPEPAPPAPKTYGLLLKITQLTQHYLSSSSPALRTSLFSLIRTTIPALAKHENSFLPLVNTLWPEVTSRLFDEEPHVVGGSLQIIATMCEYAGSFMRTRIDSLWPELLSLHRRLTREIKSGMPKSKQSGELMTRRLDVGYVDTSTRGLWQNLEELLAVIVKYVDVDAEKFDDVLRMLSPIHELPEEIKRALEDHNADAVWLAEYRARPRKLEGIQGSSFQFVQAV